VIISTPDRYVEIGGGKVNEVSYQLARAYAVPAGTVISTLSSSSKVGQLVSMCVSLQVCLGSAALLIKDGSLNLSMTFLHLI
jgi:hypothetical protein